MYKNKKYSQTKSGGRGKGGGGGGLQNKRSYDVQRHPRTSDLLRDL